MKIVKYGRTKKYIFTPSIYLEEDKAKKENAEVELIGYVEFGNFIFPLYKQYSLTNRDDLYDPANIGVSCSTVHCGDGQIGCINIGHIVFEFLLNLRYGVEYLIYHEIAHLLDHQFFREPEADEFMVAHAGIAASKQSLYNLYHLYGVADSPDLGYRFQLFDQYNKKCKTRLKIIYDAEKAQQLIDSAVYDDFYKDYTAVEKWANKKYGEFEYIGFLSHGFYHIPVLINNTYKQDAELLFSPINPIFSTSVLFIRDNKQLHSALSIGSSLWNLDKDINHYLPALISSFARSIYPSFFDDANKNADKYAISYIGTKEYTKYTTLYNDNRKLLVPRTNPSYIRFIGLVAMEDINNKLLASAYRKRCVNDFTFTSKEDIIVGNTNERITEERKKNGTKRSNRT